jgi:hypothetical protein
MFDCGGMAFSEADLKPFVRVSSKAVPIGGMARRCPPSKNVCQSIEQFDWTPGCVATKL